MAFTALMRTALGFITGNATIFKFLGAAVLTGGFVWGGWHFYSEREGFISQIELLKKDVKEKDTAISKWQEIANQNAVLLKANEKYHQDVIKVLNEAHSKDIAFIKRMHTAKEKTYHEEDGDIAPTLSSTLDWVRSEATRNDNSRKGN